MKKGIIIVSVLAVLIIGVSLLFLGNSDEASNSSLQLSNSSSSSDFSVTVSYARISGDGFGNSILLVTYEFSHTKDSVQSFSFSVDDYVFQEGLALDISYSDKTENTSTEVRKDTTISVIRAYKLNDKPNSSDLTMPVEIEVYDSSTNQLIYSTTIDLVDLS